MEKIKDKISKYIKNSKLDIENIMKDYNNYIYTIINNSNFTINEEDKEEIIIDVYMILWKNQKKLELNKSINVRVKDKSDKNILENVKVEAKVNEFLMDNTNLSTHFSFVFDEKINEVFKFDKESDIKLKDLIVTD